MEKSRRNSHLCATSVPFLELSRAEPEQTFKLWRGPRALSNTGLLQLCLFPALFLQLPSCQAVEEATLSMIATV